MNVRQRRTARTGTIRTHSPVPEHSRRVFTIGHSTREIHEFTGLLKAHGVTRVVDVRTVPRSRHNPQFNKTSLPRNLKRTGMGYTHLAGLGGLRHAKADSQNLGWRNASFRGYADYMRTPEFEQSLEKLMRLAKKGQVALMCAEAVPWRCHRSLVADALLVRGFQVEHIMTGTRRQLHKLTPFARVQGTTVTYPAEGDSRQVEGPKNRPNRRLSHPIQTSRGCGCRCCKPRASLAPRRAPRQRLPTLPANQRRTV